MRKPTFRLPKQVPVLGRPYVIKRVRMAEYGACHFDLAEIHIRWGLKGDELAETFLHELLHAILYESGADHRWSASTTESIVRALEHGLKRSLDLNHIVVRK